MNMRAQVSLEYLLISVVAIGLLTISAASLSKIRDYAQDESDLLKFRSAANSLADAAHSVCVLGSGNSREIFLRAPVDVKWADGAMQLSGESSMARAVPCEVSEKRIEGFVVVKNENGKVKIKEQ